MNIFVKKENLKTINGGYLVNETDTPVNHESFIQLQKEAHALFLISEKVKISDFSEKKSANFKSIVAEVTADLNKNSSKKYIDAPKEPNTKTGDLLVKEAMAWIDFKKEEFKLDKVNSIMQKFNLISEFEEFGLYFNTEKINKLEKIYSIKEILGFVKILEPHLD